MRVKKKKPFRLVEYYISTNLRKYRPNIIFLLRVTVWMFIILTDCPFRKKKIKIYRSCITSTSHDYYYNNFSVHRLCLMYMYTYSSLFITHGNWQCTYTCCQIPLITYKTDCVQWQRKYTIALKSRWRCSPKYWNPTPKCRPKYCLYTWRPSCDDTKINCRVLKFDFSADTKKKEKKKTNNHRNKTKIFDDDFFFYK